MKHVNKKKTIFKKIGFFITALAKIIWLIIDLTGYQNNLSKKQEKEYWKKFTWF